MLLLCGYNYYDVKTTRRLGAEQTKRQRGFAFSAKYWVLVCEEFLLPARMFLLCLPILMKLDLKRAKAKSKCLLFQQVLTERNWKLYEMK